MSALGEVARVEVVLIIGLLLVAVFFQALTGRIRISGILENKSTGRFDPGRLQLLALTALSALLMLTRLDHMRETHTISLPSNLLLSIGGSQGLYLFRKYFQVRPQRKGE